MKKKILFAVFLFLFLMSLISVSAFMPRYTHKLIHERSLVTPIDSDMYRACVAFPSLCYTGNVLTDVSVLFYYTERGKYSSTHSPSFCRKLLANADNQELLACAVGGCSHQPQDIVSHNKMVPHAIVNSFMVNNIIHVFAEQKLDNWVEKQYPYLGEEAINQLNDYDTCVPLFKKALIGDPEYSDMSESEIDAIFDKFITEVQNSQTGYDTGFKTKSFFVNLKAVPLKFMLLYSLFMMLFTFLAVVLMFRVFKGDKRIRNFIGLIIFLPLAIILIWLFIANLQGSTFNTFITFIKPFSNIVPIGDKQSYIDEAVLNTQSFFANGELWLTNTEASGFRSLDEADKSVLIADYVLMFLIGAVLVWFIWYLFKKNKISPRETFNL